MSTDIENIPGPRVSFANDYQGVMLDIDADSFGKVRNERLVELTDKAYGSGGENGLTGEESQNLAVFAAKNDLSLDEVRHSLHKDAYYASMAKENPEIHVVEDYGDHTEQGILQDNGQRVGVWTGRSEEGKSFAFEYSSQGEVEKVHFNDGKFRSDWGQVFNEEDREYALAEGYNSPGDMFRAELKDMEQGQKLDLSDADLAKEDQALAEALKESEDLEEGFISTSNRVETTDNVANPVLDKDVTAKLLGTESQGPKVSVAHDYQGVMLELDEDTFKDVSEERVIEIINSTIDPAYANNDLSDDQNKLLDKYASENNLSIEEVRSNLNNEAHNLSFAIRDAKNYVVEDYGDHTEQGWLEDGVTREGIWTGRSEDGKSFAFEYRRGEVDKVHFNDGMLRSDTGEIFSDEDRQRALDEGYNSPGDMLNGKRGATDNAPNPVLDKDVTAKLLGTAMEPPAFGQNHGQMVDKTRSQEMAKEKPQYEDSVAVEGKADLNKSLTDPSQTSTPEVSNEPQGRFVQGIDLSDPQNRIRSGDVARGQAQRWNDAAEKGEYEKWQIYKMHDARRNVPMLNRAKNETIANYVAKDWDNIGQQIDVVQGKQPDAQFVSMNHDDGSKEVGIVRKTDNGIVRDGTWVSRDADNKVIATGNFNNGVPHGEQAKFDQHGFPMERQYFDQGKLTEERTYNKGQWQNIKEFDADGNVIKEKDRADSDRKRQEAEERKREASRNQVAHTSYSIGGR